jgi:hypothetical protein
MNTSAAAVLAEIRVNRDLPDLDVSVRDYWRTYAMMALYTAGFLFFELGLKTKVHAGLYFFATMLIVARAIHDSQRASTRRFGAIVERLEKKNLL